MKTATLQDLFDRSTKKDTGCIEWNGAITKSGYGHLLLGKNFVYAHRLSFVLNGGFLPEGYFACHSCDNKKCINPEHIFAGTNSDNIRDAQSKGIMNTAKHGTISKYTQGCRCLDCKKANADHHRNYMIGRER